MAKEKKTTRWTRPRHRVITELARWVLGPYVRLRYGVRAEKFRPGDGRPYLVLANHQTGMDQFILGLVIPGPVYYLASEDLLSNGFVSRLLHWAVAPIPIKKQTSDLAAVRNCIRVAREGGTIAIFPEGNRTYGGRPCYIKPAIAKLARSLKMPVAFLRIEGGYGVHPRWSDCIRRGPMRAYVSRVMEPEELRAMTDEQLYTLMQEELWQDEATADGPYRHKHAAEYLERAMYVCPFCGLSEFESHGDIIACKRCGRKIRYTPTKELEGIGFSFPHRFAADWYDAQCDFINHLDVTAWTQTPLYEDRVRLYKVLLYRSKKRIDKNARIRLYGDRIEMDAAGTTITLPFEEISVITVLGRNKLNIYHGDDVYQFKSHKRFNALKYMNIYFRAKHLRKGDTNDEFLGL